MTLRFLCCLSKDLRVDWMAGLLKQLKSTQANLIAKNDYYNEVPEMCAFHTILYRKTDRHTDKRRDIQSKPKERKPTK